MGDYLYIEFYITEKNGKKRIDGAELYNSDKFIKEFSKEEIEFIKKEMHLYDKKIKSKRNYNYIDDDFFIRHIIRKLTPVKKRNRINKKMIGFIVGASILGILSTNKIISNKSNAINKPIVEAASLEDNDTNEDIFIENNDIEEIATEEIVNKPFIATNNDADIEIKTESNQKEYDDLPTITLEEDNIVLIDNGFENIFEFSYEDRSTNENVDIVNNNYSYLIDTYSKRYGLDPKLMFAIICQENPTNEKNYSMIAGHGVPQIEGIFNNYDLTAYNFETNQNESSGPIDVLRCVDDQDYSIKIACMIMNYQYNSIHENYGYKLNKEEELAATIWSYNKGITIINEALSNTNSFDEFKNYVYMYSIGGDNEYIEHVCSYIPDQEIITMKTRDGLLNSVMIDNTTVENTKKPTTL